jgi:hypothetical protein
LVTKLQEAEARSDRDSAVTPIKSHLSSYRKELRKVYKESKKERDTRKT